MPIFLSLLLAASTPVIPAPKPETIIKVLDGDTYLIAAKWSPYNLEWKVRLKGVDTPEKGGLAHCPEEAAWSLKAKEYAASLITGSKYSVRLYEVSHDKYGGRIDAKVILRNKKSLGDELLKVGYALPYSGEGPKPDWCAILKK